MFCAHLLHQFKLAGCLNSDDVNNAYALRHRNTHTHILIHMHTYTKYNISPSDAHDTIKRNPCAYEFLNSVSKWKWKKKSHEADEN